MIWLKRFLQLLAFGMVAIAVGAGWVYYRHAPSAVEPRQPPADAPKSTHGEPETVHLYFADAQGQVLRAETRVFPAMPNATAMARAIVQALIEGPQKTMTSTMPVTAINAVYLAPPRTAYVDFNARLREAHPGGGHAELLTIYSIVNSLTMNMASVDRVQILMDGREIETLAGHVSIDRPLSANMLLIR